MTWQRIDENTYIDDSLVTCAEYQLFIDEMREQGKYHQPDHWTSYQFPKGQAKNPVLGVRLSDAFAFSEWLTSKHGNDWLFRIPSKPEFERNLSGLELKGIGYWIREGAFITKTTSNPYPNYRHLSESTIDKIEAAFRSVEKNSGVPNYINAIRNVLSGGVTETDMVTSLSQARISSCLPLDIERYLLPEQWIRNALNLKNLDIQNFRKNIGLHEQLAEYNFEDAIDYARSFTAGNDNYLVQSYTAFFDETTKKQPKLIQFSVNLNLFDNADSKKAAIIASVRDYLIHFCIDMLTLSERIAGRSPAFEGIRLVKERK